jgi:hypothetical protein
MSVRLDLRNKRFGKLTAKRLHPQRDQSGRTRWECVCDCGKKVIVLAKYLRRGYRKNCGHHCPLRRKRRGRPFTSGTAKAKYKETEEHQDGEGIWYARRKAALYVKKTISTLKRWKVKCPPLGGRAVRTKPFLDGHGVLRDFFLKEYSVGFLAAVGERDPGSLDDALAALAGQLEIPSCPDHTYWKDACEKLGVSLDNLRLWLKKARRKFKNVRGKVFCRSKKTGRIYVRFCWLCFVPNDFVTGCQEAQRITVPEEKRTVWQAADYLGCKTSDIYKLISAGFLAAAEDGEMMPAFKREDGSSPKNSPKRPCQYKLLDQEALTRLKNALDKLPEEFVETTKRPGRRASRLRLAAKWLATNPPELAEPVNATSSQVDRVALQPAEAESFILSPLQRKILALLDGKSMTGDELETATHADRKRLYYGWGNDCRGGLDELRQRGLVKSGRGQGIRGYFRPDKPPL